MLPLGDSGLTDIDAHLSTVSGMNQFRERTTVVHVHLQSILEFIGGQIGQVQGVQLFGKGAIRHFRHHEGTRLCLELLQQIHDFSQCDLVGHGDTAVTTVCIQNRFHAVEFAVLFLAFQQIKHTFYEVINI